MCLYIIIYFVIVLWHAILYNEISHCIIKVYYVWYVSPKHTTLMSQEWDPLGIFCILKESGAVACFILFWFYSRTFDENWKFDITKY